MPTKLREAERELRKAGFRVVPGEGKGSHTKWRHEGTGAQVNLPLPKGDVLPHYLEKQIRDAIRKSKGEQ